MGSEDDTRKQCSGALSQTVIAAHVTKWNFGTHSDWLTCMASLPTYLAHFQFTEAQQSTSKV